VNDECAFLSLFPMWTNCTSPLPLAHAKRAIPAALQWRRTWLAVWCSAGDSLVWCPRPTSHIYIPLWLVHTLHHTTFNNEDRPCLDSRATSGRRTLYQPLRHKLALRSSNLALKKLSSHPKDCFTCLAVLRRRTPPYFVKHCVRDQDRSWSD